MLHSKKVGTLPVEGSDEEKQTNEIKVAAPMLNAIEIKGRIITADALLTQRELARYLVEDRHAHYHFTAKGNQQQLLSDITLHFQNNPKEADYIETGYGEHGRIETRKIWTTSVLNDYLNFPYVGQVFMIERNAINKKTGKQSNEVIYGLTSTPEKHSPPQRILEVNRGHWCVESTHYIIDWNYDEDRSQIRSQFGPENITRFRRFSISLLKSKKKKNETIAEMMKKLAFNTRAVFDYLKMTANSNPFLMS
jgi:predicted transposase YbfD/YdcC